MPPTLLADFESLARSNPAFPIFEQGSEVTTRGDLLALAEQLEAAAPNLPSGSLVALQSHNGPLFLATLLVCRRRRWPALLIDSATPDNETQRLVRGFACGVLFHSADGRCQESCGWLTDDLSVANGATQLDEDVAVVKLTSGSSGLPRGVVCSESALLCDESALFETMGLGTERILCTLPLSHSYGFSSIALAALRRDMTVVAPAHPSPVAALRILRNGRISFFPSVPAWLEAMSKLEGASNGDFRQLKLVISAGAPLKVQTAQRFQDRFGLSIKTFYGTSETGGICFDRTGEATIRGTLGTPVSGVDIRLRSLQATDGQTTNHENCKEGLVTVRSGSLAAGYLEASPNGAALSESGNLDNGLFISGDIGRFEDGELRLIGRHDDLLNLRGKKVYPSEIERVLISLEGVREAFVFANASEGKGDRLCALVACSEHVDREAVISWCRTQLPDYKVPRGLCFTESLPRTARGKIDRGGAQALYERSAT